MGGASNHGITCALDYAKQSELILNGVVGYHALMNRANQDKTAQKPEIITDRTMAAPHLTAQWRTEGQSTRLEQTAGEIFSKLSSACVVVVNINRLLCPAWVPPPQRREH